ncbi:MAG TPA: TetR/AcrR family transcriptional regulator [Porticoccaceae bacterium]|nr:TetR/AcrR family transcriptional regulator [Porticoccaceae bacterium]HIK80857.1 TetR/AcrR family transcriptional regulator [Porticoccaceae bacterium]
MFDSALDVFAQRGISNTSIENITEFAGVTHTTLYNHFKGKDESRYVSGYRAGIGFRGENCWHRKCANTYCRSS